MIEHPDTVVQVPVSSHSTESGVAVPLYPVAQATDAVPPNVFAVGVLKLYPSTDKAPQTTERY